MIVQILIKSCSIPWLHGTLALLYISHSIKSTGDIKFTRTQKGVDLKIWPTFQALKVTWAAILEEKSRESSRNPQNKSQVQQTCFQQHDRKSVGGVLAWWNYLRSTVLHINQKKGREQSSSMSGFSQSNRSLDIAILMNTENVKHSWENVTMMQINIFIRQLDILAG